MLGPPHPRAPRRLLTRPARPSVRSAAEVRRTVGAAAAGLGGPVSGGGGGGGGRRAGVRAASERRKRRAGRERRALRALPHRGTEWVGSTALGEWGARGEPGLGCSGLLAPAAPRTSPPFPRGCPAPAVGPFPPLCAPCSPVETAPLRSEAPLSEAPSPLPRHGWHRGPGGGGGCACVSDAGREGPRVAGTPMAPAPERGAGGRGLAGGRPARRAVWSAPAAGMTRAAMLGG